MKLLHASLLLGLLPLAASVTATAARAQSLEEALGEAYQNNPTILAERAHLRATDESVPQALANWRPTVELSGGAGYESFSSPSTDPTIPGNSTVKSTTENIDAKVTQPLYRGGRTVAQTSQAELTVAAERAHLVSVEAAVFLSVAQAYLDVVRDQDLLDYAAHNEQLLQSELEGLETQLKANMVTDPDKLQVESQLATASALREQAQGTLGVSRGNFLRVVGHLPSRLEPPTLRPALPSSRDEAMQLAANDNPNVISAVFAEDAGQKAIDVARGQLLPTLSVVGDYNTFLAPPSVGAGTGRTTDLSLMAVASMPLYEGGSVYSQTRQALQTLGQLKAQTDDARRAAVQSAGQAWDTVQAARAALPHLSHASQAAESAYKGVQQEELLGTRTITDVLIAEQALYQGDVARAVAEHDLAVAQFSLVQQLGTLTAADLKLKVPLYDADTHYRSVRDKWFGFGSDDK